MILSSLALKGALEKLKPAGVEIRFDATQAILASLERGAKADLLILTAEALEALRAKGHVKQIHPLGSSGVGVAVRSGAPRPDISSVDTFIATLMNARSVAHSKVGASGIYLQQLISSGKIPSKIKTVVVEKGPVGLAVARGEAEIGIQQLCELAPVAGIDIVGPLPAPLQKLTHFAAAIPVDAPHPQNGRNVLELLQSHEGRRAMALSEIKPT